MSTPRLYGLVLAGGASSRMQRDKAALAYGGKRQLDRAVELLSRHVGKAFVSVRESQTRDAARSAYPMLVDSVEGSGPIVGIRSALAAHSDVAWLVLACDLPLLTDETLAQLIRERRPARVATAFRSAHDGLPEPLCAIYEPRAGAELATYQAAGGHCPRKFLIRHDAALIDAIDRHALDNVNTPGEYETVRRTFDSPAKSSDAA
jgi:molybdenum cofactor guanylyltransferase